MASGGNLGSAFKKFATKANNAEATTKDVTRWCTDAKVLGKNCNSNNLDIAFSKVKTKGKTTITLAQMTLLIAEICKAYAKDAKLSEEEAKAKVTELLSSAEPKGHGTTGVSKTGGVSKMTDTSKYTGAHKERFDESGQGKGAAGRTDKADSSGYVGNYRGEGSYGKK